LQLGGFQSGHGKRLAQRAPAGKPGNCRVQRSITRFYSPIRDSCHERADPVRRSCRAGSSKQRNKSARQPGAPRDKVGAQGGPTMSSTVIPCLRYRDAPRMIDWLCETFGFEKHLIIPGEDGSIVHAQLSLGTGMIMVGSVLKSESEWGNLVKQPDETGGMETQTPYVVVAAIDALYERSKAAGADIVMDIRDTDYGSRDFICRDPEGHIWAFGTYDPWAAED
jgi:uncharacterized glyoxalase superfamily protein PhnB